MSGCEKEAIVVGQQMHKKGAPGSRWIRADALRELEKYQREGGIKKIGL